MVKRSTRLALVALAVVAVVGFPVVGVGDDSAGATGRASAMVPLTEDPLTTTELLTTTETYLSITETTTATTTETTTATTTATTTETSLVTTTVDSSTDSTDDTTTSTEDVTNSTEDETTSTVDDTTNESLTEATNETLTNTTDTTDTVTGTTDSVTDATDRVTNATDGVTDTTDEVVDTTDGMTDTVVNVTNTSVVLPLSDTSLKFSSTTLTATSLDSSLLNDTLDSEASDSSHSSSSSDSSGSTAQSSAERTDENATETTATSRATTTSTTTAASSASTGDRTGGRDGIVPEGASEAMVGMGALTAAALAPQLADALALVGNAGGLLSASTAFVGSTSGGRPRRAGGLRRRIDRFWRFVTPFRYSRWDDSDPLDHEVREALYETVERAPGAYLSEVCDRADVALSTARHHLDVLEDEGLVTTAKVRGKRRYYPDHAPDVELTAALEDEGTREVLHALARLGASHGGRLADELDRDASTVSHHLSRLEDAGLVEREREGRAVVNRLAPEVQAVLRGDGDTDRDTDAEAPAVAD